MTVINNKKKNREKHGYIHVHVYTEQCVIKYPLNRLNKHNILHWK